MPFINVLFEVLTFKISCVTCALANKFDIKKTVPETSFGLWSQTGHVLQTLFVSLDGVFLPELFYTSLFLIV
jgi:hypothetical protein